jgi:Polyketide cyclase / dehydrase and lipid transport
METELTPERKRSLLIKGILFANIAGVILMLLMKLISGVEGTDTNDWVFSTFIIIPLAIGLISAYFWRDTQMKTTHYIGWSVVNTIIAVILSAIFIREGVFCLLIVSPLVLLFVATGAIVGKLVFRRKNNTLNLSLYGLIVLVFMVDMATDHQFEAKVSDTIVINAPIDKVWPLVVEYEPIQMEEKYWFFKIGMPSPIQSTVTGHEEGAGRKCIFSNGYVFDEKMVVYKPNEELTFDIVSQPRDPEIMGHIDITRGQFLLTDNGDGTTTVVGNSWYKLYVFPVWYFDIWAESITRNVHIRVMEHIKLQSEKSV